MSDSLQDAPSSIDAGLNVHPETNVLAGAPSVPSFLPALPRARKAARPKTPVREWSGDKDELLSDLCRKFEAHEMTCAPARRLSERDRDYYDNKQHTPEQLRILNERGQPAIVDNFIKEKVNYQLGAERRLRSDPKAYPRTPAQEPHADAATQMIRYVADDNVFNRIRSSVWANIVVEGTGGVEIVAEDSGDDTMAVRAHQIPFDRLWWDEYSSDLDFHDARHLGTVLWGDRNQFLDLFPTKKDVLELTLGVNQEWGYDFNDKPWTPWVDSKRTRVRIVTCHWQHDGDWWTAIYTKGGFLHGPVISPYVDRRGQTCCPLLMRSGNIDRQNNRYGLVRDLIDLQDEVNARRSKLMHLLNTRRITAEAGAVDNEDEARDQVSRADGFIRVNHGLKFEIDQNTDLSTGQFQLLQHTIGRLQGHGPNTVMTGKDPRDLSGKAMSLAQAGGAVEQESDLDGLRLWSRRVYEQFWMRTRQFITDPQAIRVMDRPDELRFVHINTPITFGDALMELKQKDPEKFAFQMQRYRIVPNDPRLNQVVGYKNDIGDLDMEITVEEGADIPTMAFEQFNALVQLAQSLPPGSIPPEIIIQASALRNKDQILQQLKDHQQQQSAMQAQAAQLAQATAKAKLDETTAKAGLLQASAQDKSAQAAERVHGMAHDHAEAQATPVWQGIGAIAPDSSPLLPQNQPIPQSQPGQPSQL